MAGIELVFGTGNRAKVAQVQGALEPLGIRVLSIKELGIELDVPEDGATAQENARAKAQAYALASGGTVFSMDNALYLNGLPDDEQPGLHVRRIPGGPERPSDQQMLDYYAELVGRHGGRMEGYWEFAIAIATPDGRLAETTIRSPR
jgi:XTP/dITP diphosphohydrolase